MFFLVIIIAVVGFTVIFRIAGLFRLSIPLLYALIVPTLFHGWYYAHVSLATGIWYGILGIVAVSWIVSIIQWISGGRDV